MNSLKLTSGGVTDVGRIRKKNEDVLLLLDDYKIYAIADGMGGAVGGELASQKTIELIKDGIQRQPLSVSLKNKVHVVSRSVNEASEWIFNWAQANQVQGTGTTLVALILSDEYPWAATVLHAGDSRLYLFRDSQLKQISKDHSIEEVIGENDGRPLPSQFKGVITNAIGLKKRVSLELTRSNQLANDIWILCSDGLSKMLSDEAISGVISEHCNEGAQKTAQALVNAANDAGGRDNVSVIVVKVHECSEMPVDANAIPFDDQIDFEEPSTNSSETNLTDGVEKDTTDSSDLVSIPMPSSDESQENNLETGKHTGRWLPKLFIGTGLILLFVLPFFIFDKGKAPVVSEAVSEPVNKESRIDLSGTLSEIKQYAIRTGNWPSALHAASSAQTRIASKEDQQEFESIQSWNDQWVEASRPSFPVVDKYDTYYKVYIGVLSSLHTDKALPSLKGEWPKEERTRANEYCRRIYLLQDSMLSAVETYITHAELRLSLLMPDHEADARLLLLSRYSSLPESKSADITEQYRSVDKTLKSFRRWIEKNRNYPLASSQLNQLTDGYIATINNGISDCTKQLLSAIDAISLAELKSQYADAPVKDDIEMVLQARQKVLSGGRQGRMADSPASPDPETLQDFFVALERLDQLVNNSSK